MTGKGKERAADVISIESDSDAFDYDDAVAETSTATVKGGGLVQQMKNEINGRGPTKAAGPSSSRLTIDDLLQDHEAQQLEQITAEVNQIDQQIKQLRTTRTALERKAADIKRAAQTRLDISVKSGKPLPGSINYMKENRHTKRMLAVAKRYWKGFTAFRHPQEAVCNAMLDGRDVFVIMPTGGGKSLCYQLPALLSPGLTVVISPLIALMTDQVMHLREAGVACELLSSELDKQEINEIQRRIRQLTLETPEEDRIRLLFVTPERIVNAKTLLKVLQEADSNGMLTRIVLDEAHCCSEQGHDFRPDYNKLGMLRNFFRDCPIGLFTATASTSVIESVRKVMQMRDVIPAENAIPKRTVLFTSSLLRDNLTYKVKLKEDSPKQALHQLAGYIQEHYAGQSGIVYCLSRKDTETVADFLNEQYQLKARAYHADVPHQGKMAVHTAWASGKVKIVVATIAFGMGIDKPDVRFVIHAMMPKSVDGLYQESGRAGRDGKPADCIVFYRPQDASRLAAVTADSRTGPEKLHRILDYCQSLRCRKRFFADYFSDVHSVGMKTCGACDNCNDEHGLEERDETYAAWQIAQGMQYIERNRGRVTLAVLCDLVRGNLGGKFTVQGGGQKNNSKSEGVLKMDPFGGKVALSKDDTERLAIAMLVNGYLREEYQMTAYSVNVYMACGSLAGRLTALDKEQAAQQTALVSTSLFPKAAAKKRASSGATKATKEPTAEANRAASGTAERDSAAGGSKPRKKLKVVGGTINLPLSSDSDNEPEVLPRRRADAIEDDNAPLKIVSRRPVAPSAVVKGPASAGPSRKSGGGSAPRIIEDSDDEPLGGGGTFVPDSSSDGGDWKYTTRG